MVNIKLTLLYDTLSDIVLVGKYSGSFFSPKAEQSTRTDIVGCLPETISSRCDLQLQPLVQFCSMFLKMST